LEYLLEASWEEMKVGKRWGWLSEEVGQVVCFCSSHPTKMDVYWKSDLFGKKYYPLVISHSHGIDGP
jgi:hypothetical protein